MDGGKGPRSFNSRTLGRVRQTYPRRPTSLTPFQFTHPGKGATLACFRSCVPLGRFNSRTLGRVRHSDCGHYEGVFGFQFTHPGKGATPIEFSRDGVTDVSIHAPWEGCDTEGEGSPKGGKRFQFTHPGKGATRDRWP